MDSTPVNDLRVRGEVSKTPVSFYLEDKEFQWRLDQWMFQNMIILEGYKSEEPPHRG
jgi:hypothetical protein